VLTLNFAYVASSTLWTIWMTPIVPPPRPVLGSIQVTGRLLLVTPDPVWLCQKRPLLGLVVDPVPWQAGMTTATSSAMRRPVHVAHFLALPFIRSLPSVPIL